MSGPAVDRLKLAAKVAIADVARALGLEVATDGKSADPCPACGGRTRSSSGKGDRRGRVRIWTPPGIGWSCSTNGSEGCGERGDGPCLVAWTLCGRTGPRGNSDVGAVLAWFEHHGLIPRSESNGQTVPLALVPRPRPPAPLPPPAPRAPVAEVEAFWASCTPVSADSEVSEWLRNRSDGAIDPLDLDCLGEWTWDHLGLVRALPMRLPLPRWARRRMPDVEGRVEVRPWDECGLRLIARAWEGGPDGRLRLAGLHARNIRTDLAVAVRMAIWRESDGLSDEEIDLRIRKGVSQLKAAWPTLGDGSGTGLVLAGGPELRADIGVELVEGVPDWLRRCLLWGESPMEERATVWGVVSGSAHQEVASCIPTGTEVAIRTHDDEAGAAYIARWAALLGERNCPVRAARVANG